MSTIFLTSSIGFYKTNLYGKRSPKPFLNKNGLIDNFKKYIKKYDNFLLIPSSFDEEKTDKKADLIFKSFDMTLPFKNYKILDMRTKDKTEELLKSADFIFISGGHVPTQNKLLDELDLFLKMENANCVICGMSAGSMNMAKTVYACPEYDGEATDKNYKRFLMGLWLTDVSILPHFKRVFDETVDGYTIRELAKEDSKKHPIVGVPDNSYILQTEDGKKYMFGTSYVFWRGKCNRLTINKQNIDITQKLNEVYDFNPLTRVRPKDILRKKKEAKAARLAAQNVQKANENAQNLKK